MKKNMGSTERVIRLLIAALFAVLYFTHVVTGTLGIILLAVAAIFTLTVILGWCPIWAVLGVNTAHAKK